jgi:hypothetical protein
VPIGPAHRDVDRVPFRVLLGLVAVPAEQRHPDHGPGGHSPSSESVTTTAFALI